MKNKVLYSSIEAPDLVVNPGIIGDKFYLIRLKLPLNNVVVLLQSCLKIQNTKEESKERWHRQKEDGADIIGAWQCTPHVSSPQRNNVTHQGGLI